MNNLLLNVLTILLSTFIYHILWQETATSSSRIKLNRSLFLLCSFAIIVCMTYPAVFDGGNQVDLRLVPLTIGYLYGGHVTGVLLAGVMIGYRLLIGGSGVWILMLISIALIPVLMVLYRKFQSMKPITRILTGSAISSLFSGIGAELTYHSVRTRYNSEFLADYEYTLIYVSAAFFATVTALYFIEDMRAKAEMRIQMAKLKHNRVLADLTATFAHEIRNPLTTIRGFVQLLQKKRASGEQSYEYLDHILNEMNHLQSVISNYLIFAKPQSEQITPIDIHRLIRHVTLKEQGKMTSNSVQLHVHLDREDSIISGDAAKVEQLMHNLINHSLESMPYGGNLFVQTVRTSTHLHILFKDDGKGFTNQEIERFGSVYFSNEESGYGIDMLVCNLIVQHMGGTLEVSSTKGAGTEYAISLPLS